MFLFFLITQEKWFNILLYLALFSQMNKKDLVKTFSTRLFQESIQKN